MRFTPGVRRGEDIMKSVLTRNGRLRVWVIPTLVALIVVCAVAAMLIGRFSVSLEDVVAALRARFWGGPAVPPRVNSVVFDLRAPRIIVAILIGAGNRQTSADQQEQFPINATLKKPLFELHIFCRIKFLSYLSI